ncbi:hypothetical protein [Rhizobium phaseoli]|uniref:hypothetical protein n=1 Tax=Rhizobium phaseoli TaxID=396 RepID=UPI000BE7A396|nr:hypothetical protein [Rhizobium phaseoli]PDS28015.1 hypothetical protein CO650_28660 [Rhizobium phaseoli]
MEELVARLLGRHPHFPTWIMGVTLDPIGLGFQFAVIDRWRRECAGDVDALYLRLVAAFENHNARRGCSWPVPTRDVFAKTVALYLPMVCGISWRRILDLPPRRDHASEQVRIKRSR